MAISLVRVVEKRGKRKSNLPVKAWIERAKQGFLKNGKNIEELSVDQVIPHADMYDRDRDDKVCSVATAKQQVATELKKQGYQLGTDVSLREQKLYVNSAMEICDKGDNGAELQNCLLIQFKNEKPGE